MDSNLSPLYTKGLKFESIVYKGTQFESIVYKNEQNDGNPGLKLESLLNTNYSTMDSNLSPLYTKGLKFESIVYKGTQI